MSEKALDAKMSDAKHAVDADAPATKKTRRNMMSDAKRGDCCRGDCSSDTEDDDEKMFTDSDDEQTDSEDSGGSVDEPVDMAEIAARLGPMSSRHRRSVVSSFVPMDKSWRPPVHAKSDQDEAAIRRSVRRNLLFANISEETLQILVNAMKYVAVHKGDVIIRQGDAGDLFYILDSGMCEVVINGRVVGEVDGTSERNFFGELALLYDAPRAATVRAATDVECWSLDRVTFKRVLMETTMKQRQLYLDFIDQVPIFSTLSAYERMIVADALRVQYYDPQTVILEEGTAGDDFYIVEDGEVMCTKGGEEVSARLGSGDFFGELALVTNDVRMATVRAVRKTKCLVLDRKTFKRLLGPMQEHLRKRADLYELYMKANPRRS
ncbi:hypothetical protein ATCC90586_009745 [Pythium insidiosum]|nr:hypothetical protein ATCC90586_009745 [Pythium insidiosum]